MGGGHGTTEAALHALPVAAATAGASLCLCAEFPSFDHRTWNLDPSNTNHKTQAAQLAPLRKCRECFVASEKPQLPLISKAVTAPQKRRTAQQYSSSCTTSSGCTSLAFVTATAFHVCVIMCVQDSAGDPIRIPHVPSIQKSKHTRCRTSYEHLCPPFSTCDIPGISSHPQPEFEPCITTHQIDFFCTSSSLSLSLAGLFYRALGRGARRGSACILGASLGPGRAPRRVFSAFKVAKTGK